MLCQHVPIDRQRQPANVFVGVFAGAPHTALVLGENIKEVCNSLHVHGQHAARLSEVGGWWWWPGGGGGEDMVITPLDRGLSNAS